MSSLYFVGAESWKKLYKLGHLTAKMPSIHWRLERERHGSLVSQSSFKLKSDCQCGEKFVDLKQYQERREKRQGEQPEVRRLCASCIQPVSGCYCTHIQRFDCQIQFVILIHPIEVRRRIATGRMSHLCLENSQLISGQDYSHNEVVNQLINDPKNHSVILYPGADSCNLTPLPQETRARLFPMDKKLTVFVIDGTWATAKKMMRQSENLRALPKICFFPERPSNFRVRKQPNEQCYSTIEAIHQTIELLGGSRGFATERRLHDNLLEVFAVMVERQLSHLQVSEEKNGSFNSRRERLNPA